MSTGRKPGDPSKRASGNLNRRREPTVLPEPEETAEGYYYPEAAPRQTIPDADYVADRELSDGQRRKRMVQLMRGKLVRPPREP